MLKKLFIKLGILEDPKKIIERLIEETAAKQTDEYVKVLPKKQPVKKKAPAKKKATKKAK